MDYEEPRSRWERRPRYRRALSEDEDDVATSALNVDFALYHTHMAEAAAATAASETAAAEAALEMQRAVEGEMQLRQENNKLREEAAVIRGQLEAKAARLAEVDASLVEALAGASPAPSTDSSGWGWGWVGALA